MESAMQYNVDHVNMLTILDACWQLTRDISSTTVTAADMTTALPSIEVLKCLLNKTAEKDHKVKTPKNSMLLAL